jgi:probable phosphoglycerate mutase
MLNAGDGRIADGNQLVNGNLSPASDPQNAPGITPAWAAFNHLYGMQQLSNTYLIMRHGESEANVLKLVVTDPAVGTVSYGLTPTGYDQARNSTAASVNSGSSLNADTIVISSDFLRARQTAEEARGVLGAAPIEFDTRLRERRFGNYEGMLYSSYTTLPQDDLVNPFGKPNNVESVIEVLDRTTSLIAELEARFSGKTILLVAHGDPLGILQAGFARVFPGEFRHITKFQNAEIRQMQLGA